MNKIAISANNISKIYHLYENPVDRLKESLNPFHKQYHRDFCALNNINFEAKRGETIGIIGKNGSGKSTLLKIVAGVTTPSIGTIEKFGNLMALLELGSGFNPDMTGIENVYFYGTIMGFAKKNIDKNLKEILNFADIGDFIHQPVKTYSNGMYLRLAFAVIANLESEILIIDEALSVGDAFFTQKCMRFLRNFQKRGTILFVSHDIGAVLNLCQKVIWLNNGKIEIEGSPKSVCEKYLEAIFEERQGNLKNFRNNTKIDKKVKKIEYKDQRIDLINRSPYRNDIKIFHFDPTGYSIGKMGARIIDVKLLDINNSCLSWVVGGEKVKLCILSKAELFIQNPIIGFYVKDRLGQYLFGDNTYLSYIEEEISIQAGEMIETIFEFRMPIMPVGEYSICAAIAEGTQDSHIHHEWLHDALVFKSQSSSVATGLLGIPMENISLKKV
jgi:lipopolysaccharide transport system ATP-binding protein